MMNSADQLKNCTSASRFMIGGMPEKSPTIFASMFAVAPRRASQIPAAVANP